MVARISSAILRSWMAHDGHAVESVSVPATKAVGRDWLAISLPAIRGQSGAMISASGALSRRNCVLNKAGNNFPTSSTVILFPMS